MNHNIFNTKKWLEFKEYCQRRKVRGWVSLFYNSIAIPIWFYITWYLIKTFPGILLETEKLIGIYGRVSWILVMPSIYLVGIIFLLVWAVFHNISVIVDFLYEEVKQ